MHRALIDAAASPDPPAEVLRRLARGVDGWAASLTSTGKLDQIHPAGSVEEAEALESEVERLEVAGIHSAASFVARGRYVAIFPLSVEETVVGYRRHAGAIVRDAPPGRALAVALLSIDSIRWQRTGPAREATARCVASLVDLGHVEAARQLAAAQGLPMLHREGRVLLVRARDSEKVVRVVESWSANALAAAITRAESWYLLPSAHPRLADLSRSLGNRHPSIAPYETLAAKDGHLAVCCGNDEQFRKLTVVLGIPGTVHDVRFANNGARVTNRDDLVHVLEAALAVDTVDAWTTGLATAGVPAGRVGSIADAFELADVLGLEPTVPVGSEAPQQTRNLITLCKTPLTRYAAPPQLGEHNQDVRQWLTEDRPMSLSKTLRPFEARAPAGLAARGATMRRQSRVGPPALRRPHRAPRRGLVPSGAVLDQDVRRSESRPDAGDPGSAAPPQAVRGVDCPSGLKAGKPSSWPTPQDPWKLFSALAAFDAVSAEMAP
jgi:crotonobetainyl-CoA:carnitine CoA-transferase CaiB-like acyl-CoA transferase